MRKPPVSLTLLGVFAALATLTPLVYLLIRLGSGYEKAVEELARPRTLELLANTGALVITVTASATVLGFAQAWFVTRSNIRFATVFAVLAALPLAIPSYVLAFSFQALFPAFSGFFASWLVLTIATSPYVFLAASAALAQVDPANEEVARSLGLSAGQVISKVTWPQVRPSVTAAALLVVLYTLGEFGAVAILRFDTFTRALYNAYRSSFDRSAAAAIALVLVVLTLLVLWLESRYRGGFTQTKSAVRVIRVDLGRSKTLAELSLSLVAVVAVGLPMLSLVVWAFRGSSTADFDRILDALAGSFSLALIAGVVILIFGLAIALWVTRYQSRLSQIVERSVWVTHALPALVVGLALVFFGSNITPWWYQTLWLLVFGYLILFLPNAIAALSTPLAQVPKSLEDVSQSLGLTRTKTIFKVVLPMAAPGVLAGFALVVLTVLKELPLTLLLRPTETNTLATRLWGATEELAYAEAAPYALLLVLLAGIPALALNLIARRSLREVQNG